KKPVTYHKYRHKKRRKPEPHSGSTLVRTPTHFAQAQHQPSAGDRVGPEPAMRQFNPGSFSQIETTWEPVEHTSEHHRYGGGQLQVLMRPCPFDLLPDRNVPGIPLIS